MKLVLQAFTSLGPKPAQTAIQSEKKRYSERLSEAVAQAIGEELRNRGMKETRPAMPGTVGKSGAERRIAGGIGAKKVDVTWATEESGLLLSISIKTISFEDEKTGNFQKNLTNRRGDMLFEALTLHRRFPYAVLAGFFFFPTDADSDGTNTRNSTFTNAHQAFRLFTDRDDPAGRDEQYERFYIILHGTNTDGSPFLRFFLAGNPKQEVDFDAIFDTLVDLVAERNLDFYEAVNGNIVKR
jgi:hypothetical protein